MSEEIIENQHEVSGGDAGNIKYYYAGQGFYSSDVIATAIVNGFTMNDLIEISREDYNAWFSPPEGKYGAWVDGRPVIIDIPNPDYQDIAESKRKALLDEATQVFTVGQTKLLMGRKLSGDETESLNAWMDYIDALNDTDISVAPDIQWPTKPTP